MSAHRKCSSPAPCSDSCPVRPVWPPKTLNGSGNAQNARAGIPVQCDLATLMMVVKSSEMQGASLVTTSPTAGEAEDVAPNE